VPVRVVVLVSGIGTNLQALLDAGAEEFAVVAVGADRADAPALKRAEMAGVPTFVVPFADYPDRVVWDHALADAIDGYEPGLVVCAGFMRIVGPAVLKRFNDRVINTHPALLPAFPGTHAVRDALAHGTKVTGVTVHIVDEGLDSGPIVAQAAVPIDDDDDEETLHERIKEVERRLLVDTVRQLTRGFTVQGRKVLIS